MARGARNPAGLRLLGCLLLLALAACHRHHDVHKQLGVVTEDAIATFRAVCGVEPKREEGVLELYKRVHDEVLSGRDIVRLSCKPNPATRGVLIYDRASHRLLQLDYDGFRTRELERVLQHILFPVFDAEQRRAISAIRRALLKVDVKARITMPDNQHAVSKAWKQDHVFIRLYLFPVEVMQEQDTEGDGRYWSVLVGIAE